MPYRLRKRETVSEGCRRVLFEQTASMVSALSDHGGDVQERIHDVRKRIKRVRAMLRLVAWKTEEKLLASQEQMFRAVAHELSSARDATVRLEAFEEIAIEFSGAAMDRIRELLLDAVRLAKRRSLHADKLISLGATLRKTCDALSRITTEGEGWATVEAGLEESYRHARKYRKAAFADPNPDSVHRARRMAKRLWEQLRFIRRALPKSATRQLELLEKFTDRLGRYRDLHLLQTTLEEAAAHGLEVAKFPRFHQAIRREMGSCLKRARKLGSEIFSARANSWLEEIKHSWKQWAAEANGKRQKKQKSR